METRVPSPLPVRDLLISFAAYCACIALACLLWRQPYLLLAAYVGVSYAMLWEWRSADVITYLFGLGLGTVAEIICVYFGVWKYTDTQGIPVWLPLAWGIAILCIARGSQFVLALRARAEEGEAGRIEVVAPVDSGR